MKKDKIMDDHEEMVEFLKLEIKRRDEIISQLKVENSALLKSALKESEKNVKLSEHARSILDLNKKFKEKISFDKKFKQ